MSDSNFLILSCDGGGIRGLITATILQELDKELHFLDKIDLFSGTSTGGLIALGLASGIPISKLVSIYDSSNCDQIFKPYNPPSSDSFLDRFIKELAQSELGNDGIEIRKYLEKLLYVQYNNSGLKTVLEDNLTQPSQTLASLKSKVLVTTFQLNNASDATNSSWRPITLDNLPNNPINSEETKILDAALCTSAAPIYFPPYEHPTYGLCIDGGVFANNPSTLALARVLNSGILGERNLKDIRMLSIGTGETQYFLPPSYQPQGPLRYGATTWVWPFSQGKTPRFPLLSIMFNGSSMINDFQANMFLEDSRYQRINIELTEAIDAFGCSQIELMEQLVSKYIQSPEWDEKKTWIQKNFLS